MRFQCNYCKSVLDIEDGEPGELVVCGQCNATLAVPMSVTSPGAMLGDFAITRELGTGGMGRVYLAHQVSLDREVALKVLSEQFASDAEFIAGFFKEARNAAALNHPNIVQAYAVNCEAGCYYFAMELVEGNTMKQVLQNSGRLVHEKVLEIARDIIAALAYAWDEKKLIHRDLKPDNIMLTNDGRTKLADLGLAGRASEPGADGGAELYGTPQYIAPELILGFPADLRSDIYSMGATMYHALSGAYPFQAKDTDSMVMSHLYTPLPPLNELIAALPAPLTRLVAIMTSKRPGHRYQNYEDLLADLALVQNGEMPLQPYSKKSQLPINTEIPYEQSLSTDEKDLQGSAGEAAASDLGGKKLLLGQKDRRLVLGGKSTAASGATATSADPISGGEAGAANAAPKAETASKDESAPSASGGKKTALLLVAVLLLIAVAGGALAFMLKSKPGEAQSDAPAPADSALAGLQRELDKRSTEPEKLALLQSRSGAFQPGSEDYAGFVKLAAPLLETALKAERASLIEQEKSGWQKLSAAYEREQEQLAAAERRRAELEAKRKAEEAEQARLEQEAAQKAAEFAAKQNQLREELLQYCQKLDYSGARRLFAVMAQSEEEEEKAWANMWLDCLRYSEELYHLLRNSREKFAGCKFKLAEAKGRTRDWELLTILYDTVKLQRLPTRREAEQKNPPPQPEISWELADMELGQLAELLKYALEQEGKSADYELLMGNYLLSQGRPEAQKMLAASMAREIQINEVPMLRMPYFKARMEKMKSMSKEDIKNEAAELRRRYPQEFKEAAEKINEMYKEAK